MREVIVERNGIGDSDARESQPLLVFQIRNFIGRAEAQAMFAAEQKFRLEK